MVFDMKQSLIRLSAAFSVARVFTPSPKSAVTTLCFHRFFLVGEDQKTGLDRLKRQCEWMQGRFSLLSPSDALTGLQAQNLPDYPLVVTADDAKLDLLTAHGVFKEFEIPLIIFVCVGWAVNGSSPEEDTLLIRIVDFIRWYDGPDLKILVDGDGAFRIGREWNDEAIDQVLRLPRQSKEGQLERIWEELPRPEIRMKPRKTCDWGELLSLQSDGAEIGSHTVTHVRLAPASEMRLNFELQESRRILTGKFGHCEHFAYPYGTVDVVDDRTTKRVEAVGYKSGFLTHPDFATGFEHRFHMPRIVIPDGTTHLGEFRAQVKGGAVPLTRMRQWARKRDHQPQ